MPRYMLDTVISSYIIKRSHAAVLLRLAQTLVRDTCISAISKAELQYGVAISPRREQDRAALEAFLKHIQVLALGEDAAEDYGQIRAALKASGQMIGANDLFIAAHARSLGLVLVTNNVREFARVPGLQLENWADVAT